MLFSQYTDKIIQEVNRMMVGKEERVRLITAAILAGGNILLDDVPGVGKTTMALAFARAMQLEYKRLQFTPDIMPSDVVGFSLYNPETGHFQFQDGPIMCNLFLADEINRTSPKTQSALLEAMGEKQISVDGKTMHLPKPFVVIATQNPVGSAGTQMLPESQLDRFMICLSLGYPDRENEIQILKQDRTSSLSKIQPVVDRHLLIQMNREVKSVYIHDDIYSYMVELSACSRKHENLELGLSPRATLSLCDMAKAIAYLDHRDYVVPEDVSLCFPSVAVHRLVLTPQARATGKRRADIIQDILERVPMPGMRGTRE
ncbi:MAG: MoxR family ATPase [Clostridiales bacterium]|nr:MoxR family ATPase [Clostridiales bacterium]